MSAPLPHVVKRFLLHVHFVLANIHLLKKKKVVYVITPPPRLKNIGDQAQAVAIHRWLKKHYPNLPVLEVDKDKSVNLIDAVKTLVGKDDIIFLHSGGNLGDRGLWSENARRTIIQAFPNNKIVSLPQTIFFSDTDKGNEERENTRRIYGKHPDLTVIARDAKSLEIAEELFPKAKTFAIPDFVLSMPVSDMQTKNDPPKILLCLRRDKESILTDADHQHLADIVPYETTLYDTTLDKLIPTEQREAILEESLSLFRAHDAVITDRFHGLIFSVITRRPCVILRTVDHKLTSAKDWFAGVNFAETADSLEDAPAVLERLLKVEQKTAPDWNELYFDTIPKRIG